MWAHPTGNTSPGQTSREPVGMAPSSILMLLRVRAWSAHPIPKGNTSRAVEIPLVIDASERDETVAAADSAHYSMFAES